MDKPTEQTRTEKFFDYHDCVEYLEEKHNCELRNFERSRNNGVGEFQDYWHYVIDLVEPDRGSFFHMDNGWFDDAGMEEWQRQITEWFLEEFGEGYSREIRFWVDW